VEYVQESGFTDAAAIVPEGDLKPESDMTFELVTSPVRTIATVITASRQILDDSSQLESHINQRLAYAVGLAEERQVLYGTGIAPNLQGVMTHPRRQQYTQVAADSKIDAIRKGMTLGRIAEYPIDGLVIHPSDWESIELTKDADGRYIFISAPSEGGAGTFWRLRVVDSTAIQPGTALVGAFGMGGSIFDRQTASVRISESHADYFQRNLVLLRGESRLTVCWYRPEAFVEVVFTAPAA
jgi:HK97 family phage major capsid protein